MLWINGYTGELYRNLFHALATIVSDMIHFPACRTWQILNIKPYK